MAGLLVYNSRKQNRWNVMYYAGYALATRAANRSGDQVRQKTSLFLAYDKVMTGVNAKWSAYRERPAFYSECMLRTYARRVTRPDVVSVGASERYLLLSPVRDMR